MYCNPFSPMPNRYSKFTGFESKLQVNEQGYKYIEQINRVISMAKSFGAFSTKQLYELISSHSSMTNRLNALRLTYEKGEIAYLYQHILALEEILHSQKELPLAKYNALLVAHQMLLTAKYAALTFLELYLLPILGDIALYCAHRRKEEDLELYFIERGYRDNQQQICEIYRTDYIFSSHYQTLPKFTPSRTGMAFEFWNGCGQTQRKRSQLYGKLHRERAYIKQLASFQTHLFSEFITKAIKSQVTLRQSISPALRKLIDSDDLFITIPTINVCVSMLSNISHHFSQKQLYLTLFSSFIRQGDIYAIVIAHNATFIQEIFTEVTNVPGHQSMTAGKLIYPQIEASLQDKLDFYCQFLKCLEIWAVCLPNNEIGEMSEIAKYYTYLKDKKFIFPEILLLKKIQLEFNHSLEQKEARNEQILKIIETDQNLLTECAKWKSSVVQLSLKVEKIHQINEREVESQSQQSSDAKMKFQSLIREAAQRVEGLIYEENVSENMQLLKSFQKEWSNLKENYQSELSSSIINEGDCLKKKILSIYTIYLRYKKKSIQFTVFRRKVAGILGFQLSDFGLDQDQYDDYEVENVPQLKSRRSKRSEVEPCDKTITEDLKESGSIKDLSCWSKMIVEKVADESIKQDLQVTPLCNSQELSKKVSSQAELPEGNEYGIRQLLVKRKKYLNDSKQSKRKRQVNQKSISRNILPFQLVASSENNQRNDLPKKQRSQLLVQKSEQLKKINPEDHDRLILKAGPLLYTSQSVHFSEDSLSYQAQSDRQELSQPNERDKSIQKLNVYDVYQIQIQGKVPSASNRSIVNQQTLEQQQQPNKSYNLRSRLHLQKIRYSSTRRAIQSYAQQVNHSNSSNKTCINSSCTTSKSIINHQYKRIAFQQLRKHQSQANFEEKSIREGGKDVESSIRFSDRNVLNSSLFSNTSKKEAQCKTKVFNFQSFSEFFPRQSNQKLLKSCIKSKGLLYENQSIEIGYVHFRKDNSISYNIYLTTSKDATLSQFSITSHSNLLVKSDHQSSIRLKKGQQEIIAMSTLIINTPYSLPKITFKLHFDAIQTQEISFYLPSTFNKYVNAKPIQLQSYENVLRSSQTICLQTQPFEMTSTNHFRNKIRDFFSLPSLKLLQKHRKLAFECSYQQKIFLIEISSAKEKGQIIGYSITPQTNQLQLFLSTLCYALQLH